MIHYAFVLSGRTHAIKLLPDTNKNDFLPFLTMRESPKKSLIANNPLSDRVFLPVFDIYTLLWFRNLSSTQVVKGVPVCIFIFSGNSVDAG